MQTTTSSQNSTTLGYNEVVKANIKVHSKIAKDYSTTEPHYKAENIEKVRKILGRLVSELKVKKVLDLGCGTGFMIDLLKDQVDEIHGVDITRDMLAQVKIEGKAQIQLFNEDTAKFSRDPGSYDLVTSYSFLHHLFDIRPTLKVAYDSLKSGGKYYADLDPNFYFWKNLAEVRDSETLPQLIQIERAKVTEKDHEVAVSLGVAKEELDQAEYGKNILGGFQEEKIVGLLKEIGFSQVEFFYHWFLGEADAIYSKDYPKSEGLLKAAFVNNALQKALPLSRPMFKYVGFIATR